MKKREHRELKKGLRRFITNAGAGAALAACVWLLTKLVAHASPNDTFRPRWTDSGTLRNSGVHLPEASLVIGSFENEGAALATIKSLAREWPHEFQVYSPNLNEELVAAMDLPKSPTRFWIAGGAILGLIGGWALTILLSVDWPHHVARMPIVAIPPFTIIAFETMVLAGVGGGAVAILVHCRLPSFKQFPKELRRFKQDRIGIVLDCGEHAQVMRAQRLLLEHGAEEIHYA